MGGCIINHALKSRNEMRDHFIVWLTIQGTRESNILGGGGCFVRFSYFKYVTCCRLALLKTFMPRGGTQVY